MRGLSIAGLLLVAACGPAGGPGTGRLAIEGDARRTDATRTTTMEPPKETVEQTCIEPTLAALREEIFLPRCATSGCHDAETAREGLDLSLDIDALTGRLAAAASQSPSGMPLITPGQPGASYLWLKVSLESPLIGTQMPKRATPLDDCELEALKRFIEG